MNLTGTQGNSLYKRLFASDANGVTINLSGYTVSGHVRPSYTAGSTGVFLDLSPTIISGAAGESFVSGIIDINIGRTGMAAMPCSIFVFDVQIFSGSEYAYSTHAGYFIVNPEATF